MKEQTQLKNLSELVHELPNGSRAMQYIKRLRQAICQGVIEGTYINSYFRPDGVPERRRGVQDMMILIDKNFQQWQKETLNKIQTAKPAIRTQWPNSQEILNGEVDFKEAAERTRQLINKHTQSGKALGKSGSGNATKKAKQS